MPEWEEIELKLSQVKNPPLKVRAFLRFFLGGAQEVTLDPQGRILVPPSLREYAALDKEIYLVGMGRKFEIWDKRRHDEQILSQVHEDCSEAIAATGIEVSL